MEKSATVKKFVSAFMALLICLTSLGGLSGNVFAQTKEQEVTYSDVEVISPYYSEQQITFSDGRQVTRSIINGPSEPLPEYQEEREASKITNMPMGTIANFPSYDWVYGCSAVSAAMIAGYYDRGDYTNLYTGPTGNGLMPLTDTSWPTWSDGYSTYPSNPLIASRNGTDGRTSRGSIDDYWVRYGHAGPDPYNTGSGWSQHQWIDAVGDFMKTSQAAYNNSDGATSFYAWTSSSSPLTCADMVSNNIADIDGTYGRKLFYEARGYTVTDCYNQKTDNNAGGFTFAKFKSEIDAGHPVLLNLVGHSVVGYGYSGNTVYIRDTWDSNPGNVYSMSWGGSYEGMALQSVSIVRLAPANQAPVAVNQTVTTAEDTAKEITLVASDADGDPLTYSIVSQPTHGNLSVVAGNKVTYTPTANYFGTDSFTFRANDGTHNSNTATVSITVTAVNDAPVAQNQTATTEEDTPKEITLVATDVDSTTLTYSIVAQPQHGSLSAVAGNQVTYTPAANYSGSDSFTFKASDGTSDSNTATVSITVTAVNDPPIAQGQSVTTDEDTSKEITLVANDVDSTTLTYSILTQPQHGSLSAVSGNNVTYTPAANYSGPDSFTFKASDGTSDSNTATVSITVAAVNDPPLAEDLSVMTAEDIAIEITLLASDVDSTTLTYTIVTQPQHGILSAVSGNNVTYTPAANYSGPDSFTFKASDGTLNSNTATVSITVTAVNDAPVAQNQAVTTDEDTSKEITLVANDVDSTTLTYSILTQPTHGSLSVLTGNKVTYTPAANYFGTDSFTFKASDGTSDSNTATMSITVAAVNDPPLAEDLSVMTAEDIAIEITLLASDVDSTTLTYTIVTQPQHGILSAVSGNKATYTPASNYFGPDSFTFQASDGTIDSNTATVSITINAVNDAPLAQNQAVTTAENTAKEITLVANDVDGDTLTYSILAQPTHGSLSAVSGNKVTYTPDANYSGQDSFTFKANDATSDSNTATVSIAVTAVNDPPIAEELTVMTAEDLAKEITLLASDGDGDPLTYSIVDEPDHGSLSLISGNKVTYTPNENYNGPDSFTFKASDGIQDSNIAEIVINVEPVNDAPVAFDQTVIVFSGEMIEIELEALDVDGDILEFIIVEEPLHGSFELEGMLLKYTPSTAFAGVEKITFKVNDGILDSNLATVTITVSLTPYSIFLPMIYH